MDGEYLLWLPRFPGERFSPEPDIIIPNLIPDGGKDEFYKMIFQDVTAIAGGANWYIGLCDQTPAAANLLTDITTEPSGAGGYSRKAVVRSAVGWPTISTINSRRAITSLAVTFTAAGADFSRVFSRMFLTDQSSGTAGKLYSISGPQTPAVLITDGASVQLQYRFYL